MTETSDRNARLAARASFRASRLGRRRMGAPGEGPAFLSDWDRALFLHLAVPAEALAPCVPFPLDLRDGAAYVSLVAFTLRGLRPRRGGRAAAWLSRPLSTHGFLNVRTYVRCAGERGIFFLAEWLPNRLACLLGPRLFGLPYRPGRLDYRHCHERGRLCGEVLPARGGGRLAYRARLDPRRPLARARDGSLEEFLLERYVAFTRRGRRTGCFRVWHPPWPHVEADARIDDLTALESTGDWHRGARLVGAHYSPGVRDVWIGPPRRLPRGASGATRRGTTW